MEFDLNFKTPTTTFVFQDFSRESRERYLSFEFRKFLMTGLKEGNCRFVNGETWVVFATQKSKIKERKSVLESG